MSNVVRVRAEAYISLINAQYISYSQENRLKKRDLEKDFSQQKQKKKKKKKKMEVNRWHFPITI